MSTQLYKALNRATQTPKPNRTVDFIIGLVCIASLTFIAGQVLRIFIK